MKNKQSLKGGQFNESVLKLKANVVYKSLLRDSRFFSRMGYNKATFRSFSSLLRDYENLQNEDRLAQMIREAEAARAEYQQKMILFIEEVRKIADATWQPSHENYKKFAFQEAGLLNDEQLLTTGIRVARTAQLLKAELMPAGLTSYMINTLLVTCTQFEDSLEAINEGWQLKEKSTADHTRMSNLLLKQLVEFCNAGKRLWMSKDPQRYQDYVL